MIRRRSLLAAPALILARKAHAAFISAGVAQPSPPFGHPFPGELGNPVGHAAEPTWPGSFQNGIGTYAGLANPCTMAQLAAFFGGTIPSGSLGSPTQIKYIDIDGGGNTNPITTTGMDSGPALHDVSFIGCRFQSAAVVQGFNVECYKSGSSNIAFSYCSMVPRRTAGPYFSKVLSPAVFDVTQPGSWPSGSVGTGLYDLGGGVAPVAGGGAGTYQTPYLSAALASLGLGTTFGNYMVVDHCDMWGQAFGIEGTTSTTPTTITDNWMHDNRFPGPPIWDSTFTYSGAPFSGGSPTTASALVSGSNGHIYGCMVASSLNNNPVGDGGVHWQQWQNSGDHSEVLGFTQGSYQPPWNWTIKHNTMATLGNTLVFVWAITNFNYQNISMINNYMSGTNKVVDLGTLALGAPNTGWVFTDNIFATDLFFAGAVGDHATQPIQSQFTSTGNLWRRNKLRIYPGDNWSDRRILGHDGQFVLPGNGNVFRTTDWAF
jgi:hypothetical protein